MADPCCARDKDADGNCDRHPSQLRLHPVMSAVLAAIEREAAKPIPGEAVPPNLVRDPAFQNYRRCVLAGVLAQALIQEYDLPAALAAARHADAVGPIFDPTLWMKKGKAMEEDIRLMEAALPLWRFKP